MNDDLKQYEAGKWSGMPRYVCPGCGFESVTPALFRDHLKNCKKPKRKVEKKPIESEPIAKKPASQSGKEKK